MDLRPDLTRADATSAHAFHPKLLSSQQLKTRLFELSIGRLLSAVKPLLKTEGHAILLDFFTNHLFMPVDRVSRDRAVETLYDKMKSVTIMDCAQNLRDSVELTRLANSLDEGLVSILKQRGYASAEQIDEAAIDSAMYEENRYTDRQRLLELLCNNMRFFHRMANAPLARFMLPSMRTFARATGVGCLVDEIDAGFRAVKCIPDIDAFVTAILAQECPRLDAMFATN
jgi:hypothetical protein